MLLQAACCSQRGAVVQAAMTQTKALSFRPGSRHALKLHTCCSAADNSLAGAVQALETGMELPVYKDSLHIAAYWKQVGHHFLQRAAALEASQAERRAADSPLAWLPLLWVLLTSFELPAKLGSPDAIASCSTSVQEALDVVVCFLLSCCAATLLPAKASPAAGMQPGIPAARPRGLLAAVNADVPQIRAHRAGAPRY